MSIQSKNCLFLTILVSFSTFVVIEGALIIPKTSAELQAALNSAKNGDRIKLLPQIYTGQFTITKDASPTKRITLIGRHNSTLKMDNETTSGVILNIHASHWTIQNLVVSGHEDFSGTGISVEGSKNSLIGLVLNEIQTGIVLRGGHNQVDHCVVSGGPENVGGSGILVATGDGNSLQGNVVNGRGPSILVQEGTCCGQVGASVTQNSIQVRGQKYHIQGNVGSSSLEISGCGSTVGGNVISGHTTIGKCGAQNLGANIFSGRITGGGAGFQSVFPNMNFNPVPPPFSSLNLDQLTSQIQKPSQQFQFPLQIQWQKVNVPNLMAGLPIFQRSIIIPQIQPIKFPPGFPFSGGNLFGAFGPFNG